MKIKQPNTSYREVIEEHVGKGTAEAVPLEEAYRYVPFPIARAFDGNAEEKYACSFVNSRGFFHGVYIAGIMRGEFESLLFSATNIDPTSIISIRKRGHGRFGKPGSAANIEQRSLYNKGDDSPQLCLPWFADDQLRDCAQTLVENINKREFSYASFKIYSCTLCRNSWTE